MNTRNFFMALAAALALGASVQAGPTNITVNDPNALNENESGSAVANNWYKGAGDSVPVNYWDLTPQLSDFLEVEPGMSTGSVWDLAAFVADTDAKTLGVLTGYDMKNNTGTTTSPSTPSQTSIGNIFISLSGPNAYGEPYNYNHWTTNGVLPFNYQFALKLDFAAGSYSVYTMDAKTVVENAVYYAGGDYNAASNPWRLATSLSNTGYSSSDGYNTGTYLTSGSLSWTTNIGTDVRNPFSTYSQSLSYSYLELGNMGWLSDQYPDANNPQAWFHVTMSCGNDNLMGYDATGYKLVPDGVSSLLLVVLGMLGLGVSSVFRRTKR